MRRPSFLIWVLILLIALPTFLTHVFLWRIEQRLGLRVYHKPFLVLLPGQVRLNPASVDWHGYLRVRSGSLKIQYSLASIFTNQYLLLLEGRNLAVEFAPQLHQAVGKNQVIFDRLLAKVVLSAGRKMDIEFLDAESKTIQFHLNRSSRNKGTVRPV